MNTRLVRLSPVTGVNKQFAHSGFCALMYGVKNGQNWDRQAAYSESLKVCEQEMPRPGTGVRLQYSTHLLMGKTKFRAVIVKLVAHAFLQVD